MVYVEYIELKLPGYMAIPLPAFWGIRLNDMPPTARFGRVPTPFQPSIKRYHDCTSYLKSCSIEHDKVISAFDWAHELYNVTLPAWWNHLRSMLEQTTKTPCLATLLPFGRGLKAKLEPCINIMMIFAITVPLPSHCTTCAMSLILIYLNKQTLGSIP